MTFQSALSAGNLTKLRSSSYACDYLLKLCSNRVVFAGQLNGAVADDWAQFTYNNVTVGAYTDVVVGQAFLIADTNDKTTARFRGRIRKTPTSTIIYSNESSLTFSSGAYFWVLDTFDAQYKLSRPDANGNELIDYDSAYEGLEPSVTGLQTAYFNYDPTGGKYRIAFSVSAFAKQSGGTISSYAWTFKASTYTVISGSLSAAAVTVDISPSEQWGKLVVTDNAGVSKTRHFLIQVCDDTINPPDTGFDAPPISCDLQRGWTLSVGAFAGVDSALNNTFVVVGRANEQFGGTAGGLFTDNIAFCGWLQRENNPASSDPVHGVIETVSFDFNGVAAALARLNSQLVPFFNSAAPSAWGYILNLTGWRAVAHYFDRYTTIGDLCDLAFDVHDDTFLFPTITTQGGTALAVVQGIAAMVASVLEFAPDGRIQMVKDVTYQTSGERAADVTIADLQAQDFVNLTRAQEQNPNYGLTDTDGAYYNTANGNAVGFTARAPGIARGEAEGQDNLPAQILAAGTNDLTALTELIQRATNRFEFVNNNEYLDAEFVDGWNFLVPSRQQLYTVTASALTANGVNRINYDTSTQWVLESCTITRGDNGVTTPKGRFHKVQRIGTGGVNTTLVPPGETDFSIPDVGLPSFDFQWPEVTIPDAGGATPEPVLPGGEPLDKNGQTIIAHNGSNVWLETNFINLTAPLARQITPSDLSTVRYVDFATDLIGAYVMADVTAAGGSVTTNYDFTLSSGGFTVTSLHAEDPGNTYTPDFMGVYSAGVGWTNTATVTLTGSHNDGVHITQVYGSTRTVTSVSVLFDRTIGASGPDTVFVISGLLAGVVQFTQSSGSPGPTGSNQTYSWSGSVSIDTLRITENNGECSGACTPGGTCTIKQMTVISSSASGEAVWHTVDVAASPPLWSQGTPFTSGATVLRTTATASAIMAYNPSVASVSLSTDDGGIFSQVLTVGSPPAGGVGGFDTQRAGQNSFAAAGGKVYRASTLGGAYSAYYTITGTPPEAACIVVPYFNWAGTKQTSAANPDILIGLTGADGSGRTLLWIEGGTTPGTVHDLTPVANYVFDSPDAITCAYQHHIACAGKVSSTYTLRTTTDQGATWINRGTLTSPTWIRTRRSDSRASASGTNKGQGYLAQNNVIDYTSKWFADGVNWPRTQPASGMKQADILG